MSIAENVVENAQYNKTFSTNFLFIGCGGTLYGETGSFASPGYPASYQNQTDCEWTIKAPQGRAVTVNFAFISIDDPGDCSINYLKLYNGPDSSHASMGPYCGMVCLNFVLCDVCQCELQLCCELCNIHGHSNRETVVASSGVCAKVFL